MVKGKKGKTPVKPKTKAKAKTNGTKQTPKKKSGSGSGSGSGGARFSLSRCVCVNLPGVGPVFLQSRFSDTSRPCIAVISQSRLDAARQEEVAVWLGKTAPVKDVKDAVETHGLYVIVAEFEDAAGAKKAMTSRPPSVLDPASSTGIPKWLAEYKALVPNSRDLQAEVDKTISEFEDKEAEAEAKRAAALTGPDEDGFITVTRKGRDRRFDSDSLKKKKKRRLGEGGEGQGGGGNAGTNFYRFQQRETKKQRMLELQRKFEEDKRRIAKLREGRKFKPLA